MLKRGEDRISQKKKFFAERITEIAGALANKGILMRTNFACCTTCGHAEIKGERKDKRFIGYLFYHTQTHEGICQDIDDDVNEIEVWLGWGSFQDPDKHVVNDNNSEELVYATIASVMQEMGHYIADYAGPRQKIKISIVLTVKK